MSRWSNFLSEVDKRLERDIDREPSYGKPAKPSRSRYYFMAAFECQSCGGQNECTCGEDSE